MQETVKIQVHVSCFSIEPISIHALWWMEANFSMSSRSLGSQTRWEARFTNEPCQVGRGWYSCSLLGVSEFVRFTAWQYGDATLYAVEMNLQSWEGSHYLLSVLRRNGDGHWKRAEGYVTNLHAQLNPFQQLSQRLLWVKNNGMSPSNGLVRLARLRFF